jgi:hypothetical protein
LNLASWVLVGGAVGIAAGVRFGDVCAMLRPVGFAHGGLLEAAVYPYLICSLLHGLGALQAAKAWRLFKCGWPFFFTCCLMPPGSQEMVHFVNDWLALRKANGFRAREMSYWIEGRPRGTAERRWCVGRDVLG